MSGRCVLACRHDTAEPERPRERLMHFLEDLLEPMGCSERRHWAQVYVQGLLLDGERKSIEPMAARLPGAEVQALRQFVGQSPWTVEQVQRGLARKMVDLLSEGQVWIIDETAFPKAGAHSVGVAWSTAALWGKWRTAKWQSVFTGRVRRQAVRWCGGLPAARMVRGRRAGRGSQAAARNSLSQQDGTGLGSARSSQVAGIPSLVFRFCQDREDFFFSITEISCTGRITGIEAQKVMDRLEWPVSIGMPNFVR